MHPLLYFGLLILGLVFCAFFWIALHRICLKFEPRKNQIKKYKVK